MSENGASFIEVAQAIRVAMVRANSNDATAYQATEGSPTGHAVYGALHGALTDTLELHYLSTLPVPFRPLARAAAVEAVDIMIDSGEDVAYALAYFAAHGFTQSNPLRDLPA